MYQTLNDLEMNIQENQENQENSRKGKKRLKWILIGLGLIIGLGVLRFGSVFLIDYFMPSFPSIVLILIAWIFSILIALFVEILIIYFIYLRRTRKNGGSDKLKKRLKISLFVILPFLFLSAFSFFTKSGIIPNWFDIELLCPYTKYEMDYFGGNGLKNQLKEDGMFEDSKITDSFQTIENTSGGEKNDLIMQLIPPYNGTGIMHAKKPIVYLYPTAETEVQVKLGTPENLSHTYPKYNGEKGRNVIAQPNGDLEDMDTGRKLYALYREGKSDRETNFDEGFVVKGEDIIPFLEEKLAILGLNEKEAEEFVIYWLPQMENNERNLIRFETMEEQNENMPLNITPTPDTIIRVMMDWKAIDEPIGIPEQQLITPERKGFTVVEWGGSPRN